MMIKKYFLHLASAMLLGLTCVATPIAYATTPSVSNPAELGEVQQVLRQMGIDRLVFEYIRRDIENENRKAAEKAFDVEVFFAPFKLDVLNEKLAEIYRNHLSHEYAQKLLSDMQTPAGKLSNRMIQAEIDLADAGLQAEYRKLKPQERMMLEAYKRSANFKSFLNARDKGGVEINQMIKAWLREVSEVRVRQARKVLADLVTAEMNAEKVEQALPESSLQQTIAPTGIRAFDRQMLLTLNFVRKKIRLNKHGAQEYSKLDLSSFLKPENLVDAEKLEAGNLAILSAENLFEEEIKKHEQLSAEYHNEMQKIPMSAAMRQAQDAEDKAQNAQLFDLQIRFNEQSNIMLQLQKRILNLCEKNLGKIKLEDGRLIFPSNEEVDAYNSLVEQISLAAQEFRKLEQEDYEQRAKRVARLRKL